MRFTYQPGVATAVGGPDIAALVALRPTHPLVNRLAAAAATATSADALVEVLLSPGLRAVSDFLILERGTDGPRVVVRGGYVAELGDGGRITGSGLLTDLTLPAGTEVVAHGGAEVTDVRLPLGEGVVLADRIWLAEEDVLSFPAQVDAEPLTDLLAGGVPPAPPSPVWAPVPQPVSGSIVSAVSCPQGHLNPPEAAFCRVCRQAVPAQRPVELPRPGLGVLRLSTGEEVTLDRGVVMGRHPRLPESPGGEPVRLVTLTDPNRDTSSLHLEVVLDGWNVFVRDLGSTNGTLAIRPGAKPVTLIAHQAFPIEPGTRIVLAGAIEFTWDAVG